MVEPIGWASQRSTLHYKTVFPAMPDVGMHVNLHRNLAKKLQPKEVITLNQCNIDIARRILHRQRVALKLFSGSRLNLKGSTAHETSTRLHRQTVRHSTCPDGFNRENADLNSNYRSEGSTLLTEASLYGAYPNATSGRSRGMPPIPGSAMSRYSECGAMTAHDPEKFPDSRGYKVTLKKPIVYKKQYTEAEVQNIVNRLSGYDPMTHPAESKGQVREQPSVVSQIPRQSMVQVKKCSSEEVQQIVERLYRFDSTKWPPESKARPQIFSGRPQRTQTAPAQVTCPQVAPPAFMTPLPSQTNPEESIVADSVMADE